VNTVTNRIPFEIEQAILATRQQFRGMNAKAQELSGGTMGFVTKPHDLGPALRFWEIEDDSELEDFLFEDLLASVDGMRMLDLSQMPPGYEPLITVLEFERHCQFEGWTAVSNRADEMESIVKGYRFTGLEDEAVALSKVLVAYNQLADDDIEEFHDILGKAYGSVKNATPEIEDRIPVILGFVREHEELFYEARA